MPIEKRAGYKPLLFTTTVRNPERIKRYLYVLKKFEGKTLTDALCTVICGEILRCGIYRPQKKTATIKCKWAGSERGNFAKKTLTDGEVSYLLKNNPQKHKESGFAKGWPSRFQTIYMIARELGFVYYEQGEKIKFSELGSRLVSVLKVSVDGDCQNVEEEYSLNESEIFMHAMTKYYRDNPFLKVCNHNSPLVLLLGVLKLIDANPKYHNCGLTKSELLILQWWKDNDAMAAYKMICDIRSKYGYSPSTEVLLNDYCYAKILGFKPKKFNNVSLKSDYIDDYIRYMRHTGLISLRGAGRFVDLNHFMDERIDYIIKNYSVYHRCDNRKRYFDYVSSVDNGLMRLKTVEIAVDKRSELLAKWSEVYSWSKLKDELDILAKHKSSTDEVLKFIAGPTRLEFLMALSILHRRPEYRVCPNYRCGDDGLPTSTASGNQGDIECFRTRDNVLMEVTLLEGVVQSQREAWPVSRHLEEFDHKHGDAKCLFVAPTVFIDSKRMFNYAYREETKKYTLALSINEFIEALDKDEVKLVEAPSD